MNYTTEIKLSSPNNTLSAFRYPNFRLYFAGHLISMSGTWMQRVALGWLVFDLTQSEAWLGMVAFASGLPMLFFAPIAGVVADRFPRRKIWLVTQTLDMVSALLLAVLTFADIVAIWQVVIIAIITGVTAAFGEPARMAFIRDLVGKNELNSGIALTAVIGNSSAVVGPTVAGLLLIKVGAAWCFLLNGLSFLAVIAALLLINITANVRPAIQVRAYQQLKDGLNFARRHDTIAPMLLIAAFINVFGVNMGITLLPAFASTALRSPEAGYAALSTALGIGGLAGSVLNVGLGQRFGRGRVMVTMVVVIPISLLLLSFMRMVPPAAIIMGVLGFGLTTFFVTTNVLIQTEVPDEFRGRVISLWSLNRFGLAPVGALIIGAIADVIGTAEMMAVCSAVTGLFCGYILIRKVALRGLT